MVGCSKAVFWTKHAHERQGSAGEPRKNTYKKQYSGMGTTKPKDESRQGNEKETNEGDDDTMAEKKK